jgi:hypothetical protein
MISTGMRSGMASRVCRGIRDFVESLPFHAHTDISGAERSAAMAMGLSGLEIVLMRIEWVIFKINQVFRNYFSKKIGG